MVIGTKGGSETLYPKSIDVNGLRLFDLPGFNDTDGSERNLINAAFTRQTLLDAASVRLVFVAGQDQFTADRSSSVKQMFHSIKQLFVVDQNDLNLVDKGVFVATKMTCPATTDPIDFLLKKTDAGDKAALNNQLKSWHQNNKLCRMFHPLREKHNVGIRDHILERIKAIKPVKIHGLNVSVLYPADTARPLERMFLSVLEKAFEHKTNTALTTLSEYDQALSLYAAHDFWPTFDADVCRETPEISLLKEFCVNPYNKALKQFKTEHEDRRQKQIQLLNVKRQQRVGEIEQSTETRAREVIAASAPTRSDNNYVLFDYAYHKDYYDQVCGSSSINQLTTDTAEQEIVRQYYAGFIDQRNNAQMMNWFENFSGIRELKQQNIILQEQLAAIQEKFFTLVEEPLIKAREAEEEQLKIKQAQDAAQKAIQLEKQRIEQAIPIPLVAQGYEAIYRQFLKGRLIYRPQEGSDNGKIELPIAALANPLEGTFDLSGCGDTGKSLSIATGYKKRQIAENANKLEIWLAPKFLIGHELNTTASHFKDIYKNWNEANAVGIFWTWGGWHDLNWYYYLTTQQMDDVSNKNLYEQYNQAVPTYQVWRHVHGDIYTGYTLLHEIRRIQKFHVHFVN